MTAARGPLVVGLGSHDRGDDAVGPAVARALSALRLPGVEVVEHEDPTALIELWDERSLVIVVDAVCSGGTPGSLIVLETGTDDTPLRESAWAATGRGGTHALGLAATVELARALGRLPRRVVVLGVEAAGFDHGQPLSTPVALAVGRGVAVVTGLLREATVAERLAG
ncbi:MAG TPA: hydrogenase maturation protease [Nocardioidaceae bacterium]